MPARPRPVPSPCSPARPRPSSTTSSSSTSESTRIVTSACVACACRSVFVSASWTIRKAERSTPAGSASSRAVPAHGDVEAGGAQRLHELVETVEAGLRVRRAGVRASSIDGEQQPQLAQRVSPRRLDRAQRRTGLLGLRVEDLRCRGGLDDDHRDAVRDHVVQLPRDPRLLLARRAAHRLGDRRAPVAHDLADMPRHRARRRSRMPCPRSSP